MVLSRATARAEDCLDDPTGTQRVARWSSRVVSYTIAPEDEPRFLGAMQHVRLSRLRTGPPRPGVQKGVRVIPNCDEVQPGRFSYRTPPGLTLPGLRGPTLPTWPRLHTCSDKSPGSVDLDWVRPAPARREE